MTEPPAGKETGRVEAFSDGVFAIAITLLTLDLKVLEPDTLTARQLTLLGYLGTQWTSFVAYVMSFAVILVMWVNHHRIFNVVRRIDQPFLFWNGLLLMLVSVVPFPTALLSRYFLTPEARTAAAIYAGHGLFIALAFQGVWRYAIHNGRLLAPGTEAMVQKMTAQYRFGPLMYLVALALAFASAWLSAGLCLVFAVYFSFLGFSGRERRGRMNSTI